MQSDACFSLRSGCGLAVVPEASIFQAHNEIMLALRANGSEVVFGNDTRTAVASVPFQIEAVDGTATGIERVRLDGRPIIKFWAFPPS
jgi:hypothetical protein